MKDDIHTFLVRNLAKIGQMSNEYIEEVEKLKQEARARYKGFYGRKKAIDILIIINLIITPLLFVLMAYMTFLK
jgi:hypothetical protein